MENKNITLLIVDDEAEILLLYSNKLKRAGYTVFTAKDGEEGLLLAKKYKPTLILMDMKMPVCDGVTTVKKLRDDPDIQHLPVVFVTAFSDPKISDVDHAVLEATGTLGYIKKGLALDELLHEVEGYIQKIN